MMIFTATLTFIGCASLMLIQNRNWKAITGATLMARTKTALQIVGWVLLSAALVVCIAVEGPGFAALLWPLLIAVASFFVAMTLSFRPGLLRPLALMFSQF